MAAMAGAPLQDLVYFLDATFEAEIQRVPLGPSCKSALEAGKHHSLVLLESSGGLSSSATQPVETRASIRRGFRGEQQRGRSRRTALLICKQKVTETLETDRTAVNMVF